MGQMNRLSLLTLCTVIIAACACTGENGKESPKTMNELYVDALADAYASFEETGVLPEEITVGQASFEKGEYLCAAAKLIGAINEDPYGWKDNTIAPVPWKWSENRQWNTWLDDNLSSDEVAYVAGAIDNYCGANGGSMPNFVTMQTKADILGTTHPARLSCFNASVVMLRAVAAFKEKGSMPEQVSSWESDWLHSTANCPVDDPLVVETMKAFTAGCTTQREKAEAIFRHTVEDWEWQDYYNTSKGAVKTIQEKGGNCCDLTHATLAVCRAAGIPARYMHGQCRFKSGVIGHVIPYIYADGQWWICDPSNDSSVFGTPVWKGMETFNGIYDELPF